MSDMQANFSPYKLYPLGDAAIIVEFGNAINPAVHAKVMAFAAYLEANPIHGIIEYVPAFTNVTVYYNPLIVNKYNNHNVYEILAVIIRQIIPDLKSGTPTGSRIVEIPVCYEAEFGPDLPFVAEYTRLSEKEVIDLHAAAEYSVYMIGFAPGFPYLGGMNPHIASPRKDTPRVRIPAGSVGIASTQTGIYPIETPGGWQLIGRTPLSLFDPSREDPSLLKAGDKLRFIPICQEEYFQRKHLKDEH